MMLINRKEFFDLKSRIDMLESENRILKCKIAGLRTPETIGVGDKEVLLTTVVKFLAKDLDWIEGHLEYEV